MIQLFLSIITLTFAAHSNEILLTNAVSELQAQIRCAKKTIKNANAKTQLILQKDPTQNQTLSEQFKGVYKGIFEATSKYGFNFSTNSNGVLQKDSDICDVFTRPDVMSILEKETNDYLFILNSQKQILEHNVVYFHKFEDEEVAELIEEYERVEKEMKLFFDVLLSCYETLVKKIV